MIYSIVKDSCETHDDANEDKLTGILLHVAISGIAATLASSFRLMRSAYIMFQTVSVMVKGKYCCERLIPKAMDAVYPPDT